MGERNRPVANPTRSPRVWALAMGLMLTLSSSPAVAAPSHTRAPASAKYHHARVAAGAGARLSTEAAIDGHRKSKKKKRSKKHKVRHHHAVPTAAFSSASAAGGSVAITGAVRPGKPIGISFGDTLVWQSDAALARSLDQTVALGADWIRMDIDWGALQPTSAAQAYLWHRTDRVVDAARARGLQVLGVIAYTPRWAAASGCTNGGQCPPKSNQAFADFAGAVAQHYAGRISTYEVWNEENWPSFWPSPDPDAYGDLLARSLTTIHAADPAAQVLFGGLTSTGGTTAGAIDPGSFVSLACSGGRCAGIAGVAYHPYTYPYLASSVTSWRTPWERMAQASGSHQSLGAALASQGLEVPIWITEYGAPTEGRGTVAARPADQTSTTDHVTPELQAQIIASGIEVSAATPSIGGFFAYTLDDTAGTAAGNHYGLVAVDGSVKPAFDAFARTAAAVR